MKRVTLTDFSGGMNEAANAQLLPDNVFADILNYEYRGIEGLTKRYVREIETGLDELTDDEDNTIHPIRSMAIWYPSRMPEDAYDDKIYVIQANDRIVAYYRTSAVAWSKTLLLDDSVNKASFHTDSDRLLISDGANYCHQAYINKDHDLIWGRIGIEAPLYPLSVSDSGDDLLYATVSDADTGMTVERGNILQYCYTVEDKYGVESNPSPIHTEHRLSWRYPDPDTGGFRYYHYMVKVSGMTAKQYTDSVKANLKYYNLYRRDVEFMEGVSATQFVLIARIPITSPDEESTHYDTSGDNLADISYDNSPAPITTSNIGVNRAIFAARKYETATSFPFAFDEYLEISLSNQNAIDYISPVIAFKVPLVGTDYDITTFISALNAGTAGAENKVRLYFRDMTTPIPVMYHVASETLYCLVRLPYLDRSLETKLYLAIANTSAGVTDSDMQTEPNGEWSKISGSGSQSVLLRPYPKKVKQKILSIAESDWYYSEAGYGEPPNRCYQSMNKGSLYAQTVIPSTTNNVLIGGLYEKQTVERRTYTSASVMGVMDYGSHYYFDVTLQDVWNIFLSFEMLYGLTFSALPDGATELLKFEYDTFTGDELIYKAIWESEFELKIAAYNNLDLLAEVSFAVQAGNHYNIDLLSHKTGFIVRLHHPDGTVNIARGTHAQVTPEATAFEVSIYVVEPNNPTEVIYWLHQFHVYVTDIIYDYSGDEGENIMLCLRMNLPYFRSPLGARPWLPFDEWENNNIGIVHEQMAPLMTGNVLCWSDVSGNTFPPLNTQNFKEPILAIVEVPSFLQQEYQNTIVVFTRNTINRLVLSDDLTQMADRVDNLIKEFPYGGLYAPNSLVNTPFGLVWLSEAGLLLWSPEGVQPLTSGVLDLQHKGRPNDFYGAFYGMNNQYLLYDSGRDRTYAYHFEQKAWTRFDNMGFDNAVCLNLGSDYHNDLLLSDGEHVYRYPSLTAKASNTHLVTKKYTMDNVKPIRMRMMWNGTSPDSITATTANAFFAAGIIQTWEDADWPENEIPRFKWIFFPLGFWGEYVQFTLNNIEALTRLELDLKEGV